MLHFVSFQFFLRKCGTIPSDDSTEKKRSQKEGERMTHGSTGKLEQTKRSKRVFQGTSHGTVNHVKTRISIFSVPK